MGTLLLAARLFSFFDNIETLPAILFIVGILMLVAEIFTAGFGVAGGTGLLLLVVGIVLTAETLFEAAVMIVILLLIVAIVLWVILRSAKKGKLSRKLILWSSTRKEDGFSSTADTSSLIGQEGVAITVLRPAGTGDFDGQRMDVVTEGAFIAQGTRILVIRTEGRRIVVRPVE
ncbi:MAG: hypothetical protein GX153_05290 [Clostridiaceae bacterium]|nr:hypothetical protein [Clostridiaceae bacterium]